MTTNLVGLPVGHRFASLKVITYDDKAGPQEHWNVCYIERHRSNKTEAWVINGDYKMTFEIATGFCKRYGTQVVYTGDFPDTDYNSMIEHARQYLKENKMNAKPLIEARP